MHTYCSLLIIYLRLLFIYRTINILVPKHFTLTVQQVQLVINYFIVHLYYWQILYAEFDSLIYIISVKKALGPQILCTTFFYQEQELEKNLFDIKNTCPKILCTAFSTKNKSQRKFSSTVKIHAPRRANTQNRN